MTARATLCLVWPLVAPIKEHATMTRRRNFQTDRVSTSPVWDAQIQTLAITTTRQPSRGFAITTAAAGAQTKRRRITIPQ